MKTRGQTELIFPKKPLKVKMWVKIHMTRHDKNMLTLALMNRFPAICHFPRLVPIWSVTWQTSVDKNYDRNSKAVVPNWEKCCGNLPPSTTNSIDTFGKKLHIMIKVFSTLFWYQICKKWVYTFGPYIHTRAKVFNFTVSAHY